MSILEIDFDLSQFDEYREDNRREVKKAEGGLPVSLWDTYSSFANCYGGVIILGFKENKDGSICVKFPLKWVKINPGSIPDPNKPKRVLTEEQKEKLIQNLQKYRESKKK